MSSDSEDENFNFQSAVNFDAQQEEKEAMISNDHHFKILNEICDSFYDNLQQSDFFGHKSSWRSYSNIEPIKIKIESIETLPGICDIIKPSGNFYHKVLTVFGSIILEVDNLLPNLGFTQYESLYGLSIYGEEIETEDEKVTINEGIQISRMLTYFNEIYGKISKLLTIAINLLNQLISLYGKQNNKDYITSYKFYTFQLPFEYLGKILSYFVAIDTVVTNNEFLRDHWNKYRILVHQCKNNLSEYNITEEQKKKLDKLTKKLTAPIFEGSCYSQSLSIILQKVGEISSSGSGMKPLAQCKEFLTHFSGYMSTRIKTIYENLNKFTESYEPMQLFHYISLFGLYAQIFGKNVDKNILKDVWHVQKRISTIPLVGISSFDIETFLKGISAFKGVNVEPSNVVKHVKTELASLEKQLPYLINNYNMKVLSWTTKIEATFNDSHSFSKNRTLSSEVIIDNAKYKCKLIVEGLSTGNYLRRKINLILELHLKYNIQLTPDLIILITSGLELIKVIESEFNKLMTYIGLNLNILNRVLLDPIQVIIKKVGEIAQRKVKDGKSSNEQLYKDALSASTIFFNCSQATQSELRLVIEKLCLSTIEAKEMLESSNLETINENLWTLELINQLSREINRCCDCSFLYLYQSIFPISFKSIYDDRPKRLYYFMMAINDIEKPLYYVKYKENNGIELIKLLRKNTLQTLEDHFLKKVSKAIENDLRVQTHNSFIEGLNTAPYSDNNLNTYLNIKNFKLFDKVIDIRRYVEEDLNMIFYKMTTLNLKNWQTYQQMRVLAKHKYKLNLHEVFLPSQNLEQGKDILDIIRSLVKFSKNYTHNMHSQIFIEKETEGNFISVIGVQQIINSLYTHGKGIVNSIITKAFEVLSKRFMEKMLEVMDCDEYFVSILKAEKKYWEENKVKEKYNYPLERAIKVREGIQKIYENNKKSLFDLIIQIITQIGNIVGLVRCIRTALMDYNSQNVNLLTKYNIDDFKILIQQICIQADADPAQVISHLSQNSIINTQNSLNDSNQLFCDTINSLKQTGENEINYLLTMVSILSDSLSKQNIEIDLFAFLLPALTLTFIDNAINARDNLGKKKKGEQEASYFSDDGFIIGACFILKVFSADKMFESLSWFPSVINHYNEEEQNNKKKDKKELGEVQVLNERQNTIYKEHFQLQYFTYTSASILFTENN